MKNIKKAAFLPLNMQKRRRKEKKNVTIF